MAVRGNYRTLCVSDAIYPPSTRNSLGALKLCVLEGTPAVFLHTGKVMEIGTLAKDLSQRSNRSSSPLPTYSEHTPRLCRRREGALPCGMATVFTDRSTAALSCFTPTPTPTATPLQTPTSTPKRTPPKGLRSSSRLPPVPAFVSSRFSPLGDSTAATAALEGGANGAGDGGGRGGRGSPGVPDLRAGPFAGQGAPFSRRTGGEESASRERTGGLTTGINFGESAQGRPKPDRAKKAVPSIESEVSGMFAESEGTLRLVRHGLGDERVPTLSLERLREIYRMGRGSICSWRTNASLVNRAGGASALTALIEVEQGRLGVLSSNDAYVVHFKEMVSSLSPRSSGSGSQPSSASDALADKNVKLCLVYVWSGRDAGEEAVAAARVQGNRLLQQQPNSTSRSPLLEVEQGCEPALFLALFSYMCPPLAAVVLQGRDETPELRVLELQESPCLPGSGIVMAVEGSSSASLLAKHGPLPDRSYICLVRPRHHKVGGSVERGGADVEGGGGVGTFDAAYYWHGVEETPAVEGVGILLCQQVDRMFPSPSIADCGKRRGIGRRRRGPVGVGAGDGMMRGFIADVKLGMPLPDGFLACLLPEKSTMPRSVFTPEDRKLLSNDLRPACRSRPVRVFGVCAWSRKARQSFVWEVGSGGMPSQMRLSPSLSHVVDAGASCVYVWHGSGSSGEDRRLAYQVARAYAERVEGGASVEQADAGSEPVGFLDCFIGWNQDLVEPPPMLSLSPGRRYSPLASSAEVSPLTPNTTPSRSDYKSKLSRRDDQGWCRQRSSGGCGTSSESSGSRLTPPGQRTPTLNLASPPSLKNLAGGVLPPSCFRPASNTGVPASSEVFSTPPVVHAMENNPTRGCYGRSEPEPGHGGFHSPRCLFGLKSCIDAVTADCKENRNRVRGFANASSLPCACACDTSSSSPSTEHGPDGEFPGADAGHNLRETLADADRLCSESGTNRQALLYVGRNSGGCAREVMGGRVKHSGYGRQQQYVHGHGKRAEDNEGSQCERAEDGGHGKGEHTGDDEKDSGRVRDDRGGWQSSDGGGGDGVGGDGGRGDGGDSDKGGGGDDDRDGAHNSGESGSQDGSVEDPNEDDDGEDETGECVADGDMDTFLRLSEVELCEGRDVLQHRGAKAKSSTDSEVLNPSIGVRSSGGGVDSHNALSRHLSDFFRSPLELDSTPNQHFSCIKSASGVETEARFSDSLKSNDPDDNRSSIGVVSHSTFGSTNYVGGGPSEATGIVPVTCNDSPTHYPSAVADAAATIPDPAFAEENDPNHDVACARPLHDDKIDDALVAESNKSTTRIGHGVANANDGLIDHQLSSGQVETAMSETTEAAEEGTLFSVRDDDEQGSLMDGGGGESEEEWLTHPDSDDAVQILEKWSLSSESTLPSLGDQDTSNTHAVSDKRQRQEAEGAKTAGTVGHDWAGLNEDGSWRTEVDRRAAGEAGAVEAERRRIAKISADESWRLDTGEIDGRGGLSTRDIRRESVSFTRLQTGNVRMKLHVFEGSSSSKACTTKADNRSSIGALEGRGFVSAWTKKSKSNPAGAATASAATTAQAVQSPSLQEESFKTANACAGNNCPPARSTERQASVPLSFSDDSEASGEFLWKAGPAPCRLRGRPSLGLIRNGQVRIMTKALLSGEENVSGESGNTKGWNERDVSSGVKPSRESPESKTPSTPLQPPPPPVVTGTSSFLKGRPIPGTSDAERSRPPPQPSTSRRAAERRTVEARSNVWLARAGLTRKKLHPSSPASAPATPPRNGGAWRQGGGTRTPPPTYLLGGRSLEARVAAEARVVSPLGLSRESRSGAAATNGALARLHRRLEGEAMNLHEDACVD